MFIRQRHVKARGKTYVYYSIVETTREDGKPRQRTVYDMGRRATIAECIRDARGRLEYWLGQDQQKMDMLAAMVGMRTDPDHVAKARARCQAEIDLLADLAAKVGVTKT